MKKNICIKDRLIRFFAFVLFGALLFKINNDMLLEVLIGFLGIYCFFSAVFEFCLLYQFMGINTRSVGKRRIY